MAVRKARVGSEELGRKPRVRPVPAPELPRMSVDGTCEESRAGAWPNETVERPRCP